MQAGAAGGQRGEVATMREASRGRWGCRRRVLAVALGLALMIGLPALASVAETEGDAPPSEEQGPDSSSAVGAVPQTAVPARSSAQAAAGGRGVVFFHPTFTF